MKRPAATGMAVARSVQSRRHEATPCRSGAKIQPSTAHSPSGEQSPLLTRTGSATWQRGRCATASPKAASGPRAHEQRRASSWRGQSRTQRCTARSLKQQQLGEKSSEQPHLQRHFHEAGMDQCRPGESANDRIPFSATVRSNAS